MNYSLITVIEYVPVYVPGGLAAMFPIVRVPPMSSVVTWGQGNVVTKGEAGSVPAT